MATAAVSPVAAATTTTIFLSLLLFSAISAPIPGLESFLTHQFSVDPHATNDTLNILPSRVKFTLSSTSSASATVDHRISALLSLSLLISVNVKLVGSSFSSASPASSTPSSPPLFPPPHSTSSPPSHHLPFSHSLHLDSSLSPPSLSLSSAIRSAVNSSVSSLRSPLAGIPYAVVDSLIDDDFKREKQSPCRPPWPPHGRKGGPR